MFDITHHIISGIIFQEIRNLMLTVPPQAHVFNAGELGFTLISPDSRRRGAVAGLGTVIPPVPSNCYIRAPKGNSMWRVKSSYTEEMYQGVWVWWLISQLVSISDNWVMKKNVSALRKVCFHHIVNTHKDTKPQGQTWTYFFLNLCGPSINQWSVLAWNVGDLETFSDKLIRMLLTIQLTSDFQIVYLAPSLAPGELSCCKTSYTSVSPACPVITPQLFVYNSCITLLALIPYLLPVQLGFSDIDSSWFYWVAGKEI